MSVVTWSAYPVSPEPPTPLLGALSLSFSTFLETKDAVFVEKCTG